MRVYVTDRGVRCQRQRYMKVASMSRQEARFFKNKGALDLPKETAEILIAKGWASADPNHPLVEGRGANAPQFVPEPIEVETQVVEVEHITSEVEKTDEELELVEAPIEEPPEGTIVESDDSAEIEEEDE